MQTTLDHFSQRRRVGPRFVRFAGIFYGALVVAAVLWSALRGRDLHFLGDSVVGSLLLGALSAAFTISLGLLAYRFLPVLREVAEELAPRLVDRADRSDLVLVAIFSGLGEETFFRGALQPEFGLVVTSLVFGLVHLGPDRRYLVWTAWAVLAGFVFGALYEITGGLLAPTLAHCAHNAVTLLLWRHSRKGAGEANRP